MKFPLTILFCVLTFFSIAQNWSPVTTISLGETELFSFDDKLFVGGDYIRIDNTPARGIAYWNKRKWETFSLDALPYTSIKTFSTYQNQLYGFGEMPLFSSDFNEIVRYDQQLNTWIKVPNSQVSKYVGNGNYKSGRVEHAIEFNGALYIAGDFDYIGTHPARNIAKWDGTKWSKAITVSGYELEVHDIQALEIFENKLIIAGSFSNILGASFGDIISWDGELIDDMNGGVIPPISGPSIWDLAVYKGELYASGRKLLITNNAVVYHMCKWNGSNWVGVPGFEREKYSKVKALYKYNGSLIIGITDNSYNRTALIYNNGTVKKLEQNLQYSIKNFQEYDKELFTRGVIISEDDLSSTMNIVKLSTIKSEAVPGANFTILPNPTRGDFFIDYELKENSATIISVFNPLGSLIEQRTFNDLKGTYLRGFDLSDFPNGVYVVKVKAKGIEASKILIKN